MSESSFTEVRTPMGVAARGFALWAHSATRLWTVLVPVFGVAQLIGFGMIVSAAPAGSFVIDNAIFVPSGSTSALVRAHVLLFILIALVGVYAVGAALRIFGAAVVGESATASDAARFGLSRYGSLLWVSILVGVCTAGASVLLILPGIYVLVAFSAALPVVVLEDARGGKALMRSRQLVKGRWWATLGALLPCIALLVFGDVVVAAAIHVSGSVANLSFTQGVAQLVLEVLLTPILTATTVAIYEDLRAREQARGVAVPSEPVASGAAVAVEPAAQAERWWG